MNRLAAIIPCVAASLFLDTVAFAQTWGPPVGPPSGNTLAFARGGTSIYALLSGSGVYGSTDEGTTWRSLSPGQISVTADDLPLIAASGQAIYVSNGTTGEIHESDDGGATWMTAYFNITGVGDAAIQALAADDSGAIYVGSSPFGCFLGPCPDFNGVYKSTDQGLTWTREVNGLSAPDGESIALLLYSGGHLYAATGDGLYRSDDQAASWQRAGLAGQSLRDFFITDAFCASTYDGRLFRSPDDGSTWSEIPTVPNRTGINFFEAAGVLFEVTDFSRCTDQLCEVFFVSQDDGATWAPSNFSDTPVGEVLEFPNAFILASERILLGTSYQGVLASADGGTTWQNSNRGLLGILFAPLTAGDSIYAGNGIDLFSSTDRGESWNALAPPAGILLASTAFHGSVFLGTGEGILRSDDAGASWRSVDSGFGYGSRSACAFLTLDGILYAGLVASQGESPLYRSTDGETWATTDFQPDTNSLCSLTAVGSTMFAASSQSLYRSTDGAASWAQIRNDGSYGSQVVGVGSSIFYESSEGFIRSDDLGDSWVPAAPMNSDIYAAAASYGSDAVFALGRGVYVGSLQHGDWHPLSEGLANLWVTGTQVSDHYLYAFPAGAGLQRFDLDHLTEAPHCLDAQACLTPISPATPVVVSGRR